MAVTFASTGQRPAEGHVVAGEAERAEIGGDEVAALRRQHPEAEPRRGPAASRSRLAWQAAREAGEIGVVLGQPRPPRRAAGWAASVKVRFWCALATFGASERSQVT
jgi:hypothetical protein